MTLEPLLDASLAIQIHAAAAIAAFVLGGFVLFRRKGDRLHKIGGRIWAGLMLAVIVSSFFIHTIRLWGPWSPIHLVSIGTLIALWRGVGMARLKNIAAHRRIMQGTYAGALILAGFFSFMPGRIMYGVLFGGSSPMQGVAFAAAVIAISLAIAWVGLRRSAVGIRRVA